MARLVHDAPSPPSTEAKFPCWTATESCCNRKSVERDSPVSLAMRRPTSFSNDKDFGPWSRWKAVRTSDLAAGSSISPLSSPYNFVVKIHNATPTLPNFSRNYGKHITIVV